MATKSQEILLKGNTTNASAVPSSLKVREIAINALDRSLFTNDGNSIVKLYTGTTKWFDVNGNANNALKLGGILASEYINKEAFNSHINNSTIHITATERNAWNNKWDYNEETIKGVKVNAAVNADYASSASNADTLDGYHADIMVKSYIDSTDNLTRFTDRVFFQTTWVSGQGDFCSLVIPTWRGNNTDTYYTTELRFELSSTNPKIRFTKPSGISDWYTLARTIDNVASASKLQDNTAFTAWGQTFFENGKPKNVSGDLINVGNITASGKATIQGDIVCGGEVVAVAGEGTPAGVTDYSALTGKPSINGVTLVSGNNTLASLGIQAAGDYATNSGVTTLLANYADKTFVSNNYVGKSAFNNHTADSDIHITATERAAWNAKWNYNEATIKAVKVTSASSADSVAWTGIKNKPTTFTPSAHTHTASDVSGLPTSLKNPYALTFGSKTYDGSAAATITASDLGALTSITKSMVEGVLTGDITSHTHSYLPLSGGTLRSMSPPLYINRIGGYSSILYQVNDITVGILGFNDNGDLITRPNSQSNANYYNIIHSGNYNSYAPTLTGTGASGTWGISITGNAATATNATNADKLANITASTYFKNKDCVFNSDWGATYLWTIWDNHLYAADKRFAVTLTGANSTNFEPLFDGNFESSIVINSAQAVLHIKHTNAGNVWSEGLPYGSFYVVFYNSDAENVTSRVYCNYAAQGIGWHTLGVTHIRTGVWKLDNSYYQLSDLEITITKPTSSSYIYLCQILHEVDRSPGPYYAAVMSKYCNQKTNYTIEAAKFIGPLQGNANTANSLIEQYVNNLDSATYGRIFSGAFQATNTPATNYATGLTLYNVDLGYTYQLAFSAIGNIYTRYKNTTDWQDWKPIAFTDSNVASATKLQTPRTIWGQSFDGTSDISGIAYFPNGDLIHVKDEGGTYRYVMGFTSALGIGYGSASAGIDTYIDGNNVYLRYSTSHIKGLTLNSYGNVLIGTTTDNGYKLQVNGSERVYGDLIVDGEVSALVA